MSLKTNDQLIISEMSRRPSETYEKIPPNSNLEKNCHRIFVKGPKVTRGIIEKMQNSKIGRSKTCIWGYEIETRQFWVISGLLLLFLLSSFGTIVMWYTDMFDNAIFANLAIVEGSDSYEMWRKPSPKPLLKMYIFNYTNVDEFENKDVDKLNVKELGPYIYEITLERINAQFNGSKVSYQEERHYKFMPELSKGKQNDQVMVPNIPLLSAAATNKNANFLTRMGVSSVLNGLNAKPFMGIAAHRFIVGYEDNLYKLSKSVMKFQNQNLYERFGLVASTVGLRDDVFTINTGKNDINKIGTFDSVNGQSSLPHWSTDECNAIHDATDGSFFSPKQIRNKRPVSFYMKDTCRTFPLYFEKEVKILNGKIPAYRYSVPLNVFDSADRLPSNQCYCNLDSGECPAQGIFNATPCAFGAPAFVSFPHFYNADPELKQAVTGLNPKPEFSSYVDVHPTLGFVMAGKTRLQMNVKVAKAYGITQVNMFEDGQMLPVAWFELSLEDKTLPEDMVSIIFQTTFTLKSIELGLKYGCLLAVAVTLTAILIVLSHGWHRRDRTSSIRTLQRQEESV